MIHSQRHGRSNADYQWGQRETNNKQFTCSLEANQTDIFTERDSSLTRPKKWVLAILAGLYASYICRTIYMYSMQSQRTSGPKSIIYMTLTATHRKHNKRTRTLTRSGEREIRLQALTAKRRCSITWILQQSSKSLGATQQHVLQAAACQAGLL